MDAVTFAAANATAKRKYETLLRHRELPVIGDALATSGEVPTVSFATTTTLASGTTTGMKRIGNVTGADADLPGDPTFAVGGTPGLPANPSSPNNRVRAQPITGGTGQAARYAPTFRFMCDASAFEVSLVFPGSTFDYRLSVDGKRSIPIGTMTPGSGSGFVKFDFGTAKTRQIDLTINDPDFLGVRVATTYNIWRPVQGYRRRLVVVGDSITQGANGVQRTASWVWDVAAALGCDDVWNVGIGGTGWVTDGTSTTRYSGRLTTDLLPILQPRDVLLFFGSRNDPSGTQGQLDAITAGVTSTLGIVAATQNVIVAGNMTVINTMSAAVAAGATAAKRPFIDASAWMNGTGNAGTRTVTDGATTSASTTITSATAAFAAGAVSNNVTGAGIPAGAFIASVTNSTTAVLSVAATATATGVTLTFDSAKRDGNSDRYISSDSIHPTPAGHLYLARRWINGIKAAIAS